MTVGVILIPIFDSVEMIRYVHAYFLFIRLHYIDTISVYTIKRQNSEESTS